MSKLLLSLNVGDKIKFGKIFGQPIVWKILEHDHAGYPDDSTTLWSEKIIACLSYDAKETSYPAGYSHWGYSNIRQWLNSDSDAGDWYIAQHNGDAPPSSGNVSANPYTGRSGFLKMFSGAEKALLLSTTIQYGSTSSVDKVFLLSRTEQGLSAMKAEGVAFAVLSKYSERMPWITARLTPEAISLSGFSGTTDDSWKHWTRSFNNDSAVYYVSEEATGASSEVLQPYYGYGGVRPGCNIPKTAVVSDDVDEDGCYSFIFNTAPSAPSAITVPNEVNGGNNAAVSWTSATDVDGNLAGYKLEQSVNGGEWSLIYTGTALSYNTPITYGWDTVQYRVKSFDTLGAESEYVTSEIRSVVNNHAPSITGHDAALGTFDMTAPSYSYTVTDEDGDVVTVEEELDGSIFRSYTAALGTEEQFIFTDEQWLKLLNGDHTVKITAKDVRGAEAVRTMTFIKNVASVSFEKTVAMAVDTMPTKALINIQGSFPDGCTLKVEICNNGNDTAPTWEDVTSAARSGEKYFFANTTKTAVSWGVRLRVTLVRGTASGQCYISSLGGNFE